jgi:N6-L-threonylcarbamoyladenine synthase
MQGHILSHFIHEGEPMPKFPFLCLTVSGGHTQIVRIENASNMQVIGTTIDDAAGEAFDKSAKILGLPYPGGPHIDEHAKKGNIHAFEFGKPKIKELDFSFSGLKTSILYKIQNNLQKNPRFIEENLEDLCASIQHSIVSILLNKLGKAIKLTGIKQLAIAGGVSANSYLRSELGKLAKDKEYQLYIPKLEYCTDNAAMIAIAGYFKYIDNDFADQSETPSARLSF